MSGHPNTAFGAPYRVGQSSHATSVGPIACATTVHRSPDRRSSAAQVRDIAALREATDRALADAGLEATVADVGVFPLPPELVESRTQLRRVEELSDAHHLELGDHGAVVAYLLEVRHRRAQAAAAPWAAAR